MRHDESPNLHLRWGRDQWLSLKHSDVAAAKKAARDRSATLLAARGATGGVELRLGPLLDAYELAVTPTKSPAQRREDRRRIEMWTHVLGKDFDPLKLTGDQLKAFERARRAGKVAVPGRNLRAVRRNAIRADLSFLRAVFNWASGMASGRLLARNPMEGYRLPVEINPRRPVAFYDDYLAVQRVAGAVHPLFPALMQLLESLGWRITAVCRLQPSDLDTERTEIHPHGRLLKRWETDKVGVERWTVLSADARAAMDEALALTGKAGRVPLFELPNGKPWSRWTARKYLDAAYELAEVPEGRRVGPHAFRRKWVTERKHLPPADVAEQGGWLSVRTLDIYAQPDPTSLLAVAESPHKLHRSPNV
jgi:integrase